MMAGRAHCMNFLKFVVVAALFGASHAHGYKLGGVSCAAAPQNSNTYCIDSFAFADYRNAVADPGNFGAGGTVPVAVTITAVSSFAPGDLAALDGLVVPWWGDLDAAPHAANVVDFFRNGGDLFILADDSAHDAINAALGIPIVDTAGSAVPKPTTGNAPLHAGPFGTAAVVNQLFSIGRLDVSTVLTRKGHIVGNDATGAVSAAVWDRGQYAPGAGRLVIVTDVNMMVSGFAGALAAYSPPNDNGRFILNATAFLVNGGTVNGFEYDLIGVPSCAITPNGLGAYCGATGFTVTFFLRTALEDLNNFGGPGAPVPRRAALVEFDDFTPEIASTLKVVLIPWIQKLPVSDAAPYATQVRDWYLAGGNLWLLQDDPLHDPIGELLGVPTPIATGTAGRLTNGVAPAFDGPFGIATDVIQAGNVGGLDPTHVAAHGGTIVGQASDGTGDNVVAVWRDDDYAPGAGRMVISTDVDSLRISNPQPPSNATWMKNIAAFLLTDSVDTTPPAITCAADPVKIWPPNGKAVKVGVSGTISDAGGLLPGGSSFSVADEYGQVEPAGAITVNGGGAYAFTVPLVAARNGGDADGRDYVITVQATDTSGNAGTCRVVVNVPHDQGKK